MDILQLVAPIWSVIFTVISFIAALSVIVTIHEYGHYIVGRWCGIKADVFSLGFGPVLMSRVDRRGTRWQLAAYPLGGYVKFSGDDDPASLTAQVDHSDENWIDPRETLIGAPLWARVLTVAAGPVFNFILAVFIFAAVIMWQGNLREPLSVGKMHPAADFVSQSTGQNFKAGDVILSIEGLPTPDGEAFSTALSASRTLSVVTYSVERNGEAFQFQGPNLIIPAVASLQPRSSADRAGLKVGDVILQADGVNVRTFSDLVAFKDAAGSSPMSLQILRDGERLDVEVTPKSVDIPTRDGGFETKKLIGVTGAQLFEYATDSVGIGEALSLSTEQLYRQISGTLSGVSHMIRGSISTCNLSGPVGIAEASGSMASQGPQSFILFIASLSVAIGFLNLLPIPVLDGGHLALFAYEAVFRRKPNEAWLKGLIGIGVILVGSMMIFGLLNDTILCV